MPGQPSLIVIGTSAGGVCALRTLMSGFTKEVNAAVCLARHVADDQPSHLPEILNRCETLPVFSPLTEVRLQPGQVYLAPPGYHLLIAGERVIVSHQALPFPRDDIDRLFYSAALSYGKRVIGVLLTGQLHDGTRGMQAVKQHGGATIIQDPDDAAFSSMPRSAQAHCQIDYCLPLVQIAPLLQRLAGTRLLPKQEPHDG